MATYRRTQVGRLVIATVGAVILIETAVLVKVGIHPLAIGAMAFLGLCLILFCALTVTVTNRTIRVRFGPGPIGKTFELSSVQGAKVVRNKWYYGWGIRKYPGGWLYNVSGLDAVEIVMADGRKYRIGTDEPRELLRAIEQTRNNAG